MENISARFGRLASSVWCWVPYKEYGMPPPQQQKWQRPTERDIIPGLKLLDHADMDAPGSVNFKIAWRSWLSKCLSKKLFARSCPVLVKVVSFPIMAFFKFWFWLDPPTTFRLEYRFKKYAFYGRPLMDGHALPIKTIHSPYLFSFMRSHLLHRTLPEIQLWEHKKTNFFPAVVAKIFYWKRRKMCVSLT